LQLQAAKKQKTMSIGKATEKVAPLQLLVEYKLVQPLWKTVRKFLKK
jgi:hypothetical protein